MLDETDEIRDRFKKAYHRSVLGRPNDNSEKPVSADSLFGSKDKADGPRPIDKPLFSTNSPSPKLTETFKGDVSPSPSNMSNMPPNRPITAHRAPNNVMDGFANGPTKPTLANSRPEADQDYEQEVELPKKSSKKLLIVFIIMLLLGGGAAGYWYLLRPKSTPYVSPLPAQYSSQSLGFTVYFPKNLPDGARVAPASYGYKDKALTFVINTPSGLSILVSEQSTPDGATADDLVPAPKGAKYTNAESISVTSGKAAMSNVDEKTLISVVYDKTWIIFNVTGIPKDEAISLVRAFEKL